MKSAMILLSFVAAACQATPAAKPTPSTEPATAALVHRPTSAYRALHELLGVVERNRTVVLRRIECDTVRGTGTASRHVRAVLDLVVAGGDSIQATRDFNRLEVAIRATAWCLDFQSASTKVLPEDRGILSDGVVVLVDPSAIPVGTGERAAEAGSEGDAVLVHARQAAARTNIGQIDCAVRMQNPERGVEEAVYRFRPTSKETSFRLDDLRGFFRELDAFAGGEITSIDLAPATKPAGTGPVEDWIFQVELTTRPG